MKRPLKHYAIALYDALHTEGAAVSSVAKEFVRLLARDGVLAKASTITELFRKEWNRRQREIDIEVIAARDLTGGQEKHVVEMIRAMTGSEKVNLHTLVDPEVIGGIAVHYNDVVLDGTVRRQLATMHHRMSNG